MAGLILSLFFPLLLGVRNPAGLAVTAAPVCADVAAMGASWYYDWSPAPTICPGAEAIPMIWGECRFGSQLGGNSPYVIGFNEPDRPDQAAMTPHDAAIAWHDWIEALYPDRLLVSPAPTYFEWLDEWRAEYVGLYGTPPRVDVLAGHIYVRSLWDARYELAGFAELAAKWDVPLWVTEFAFLPCWVGGEDVALNMAQEFTADMERAGVVGWAWFGSRKFKGASGDWTRPECATWLFDDAGPTPFGEWYAGGLP